MDNKADILQKEIIPHLPNTAQLPQTVRDIFYTALYQCFDPERTDNKTIIHDFARIFYVLEKQFASGAQITAPLSVFLPYLYTTIYRHKISLLPIPYRLHADKQFSHTYICARHGSGKTTLLENLIDPNVRDVKTKDCCVVVMDSQGRNELLGRIEKWKIMDEVPYQIIDSKTPMNPLVLPDHNRDDPDEREMAQNGAIEMLRYVFSGALGEGGALTDKMKTPFDYCMSLLLCFPSTIFDFLKLVTKGGLENYKQFLPQLSEPAQLFFATQFNTKLFGDTKDHIAGRLAGLLRNPAFERMFATKKSFDFYAEMQKPQVLLIDADIALLKEDVSGIMQRYVIAQLLSAAERRNKIYNRLPTYVYVDEATIAIADDPNVTRIINRARKFKVGFTFAIQSEDDIENPRVLSALNRCEYQFTPAEQDFKWNMTLFGEEPIIISSPLVDRGVRREQKPTPKPKQEEAPQEPAMEGEVVEPYETTPVDNLFLTYDNDDISPR